MFSDGTHSEWLYSKQGSWYNSDNQISLYEQSVVDDGTDEKQSVLTQRNVFWPIADRFLFQGLGSLSVFNLNYTAAELHESNRLVVTGVRRYDTEKHFVYSMSLIPTGASPAFFIASQVLEQNDFRKELNSSAEYYDEMFYCPEAGRFLPKTVRLARPNGRIWRVFKLVEVRMLNSQQIREARQPPSLSSIETLQDYRGPKVLIDYRTQRVLSWTPNDGIKSTNFLEAGIKTPSRRIPAIRMVGWLIIATFGLYVAYFFRDRMWRSSMRRYPVFRKD